MEIFTGIDQLGDLSVDGRIILKRISEKYVMKTWMGHKLPRIWSSGGVLWMLLWIWWFHNTQFLHFMFI